MATRHYTPPWDYLYDASSPSLQSYELSRLNHAANLRREIAALIDQWIEDSANALLARWVREGRERKRPTASAQPSLQPELLFGEVAEFLSTPRAIKSVRRRSRAATGA